MRKLILIAALTLTACASQIMQGYVGQPVQQVMVKYGTPISAFDMGDGRRAFQWRIGHSYTPPTTVTNSGTAYPIGNSVWWTQSTQISGGQPITGSCIYTLYGRWSASANAWLIDSYEKPPLMCE